MLGGSGRLPGCRRIVVGAGVAWLLLSGVATAGVSSQLPSGGLPPVLAAQAAAQPDASFSVIVRGQPGDPSAAVAALVRQDNGDPRRQFDSINGVAVTLTGAQLTRLARNPHIGSIVPDAPMYSAGIEEAGLWGEATDADQVPSLVAGAAPPAIAIVDSGVDATKTDDFGARVVASVNLNSDNPGATGDDEGHGTMVAGIAAGASTSYPGVAPTAPIVSLRTADANGASHMSDVIAAVDWILANKSAYDIRVANFSMVSAAQTSFTTDPLDAAVEQLWFSGVVVVAAVGNYGQPGGVPVLSSPGNDPFVISVGALDTNGTADPSDDFAAPWSVYGHTGDGFAKPELSAPGRWIVAPVPSGSTLATTDPDRVVAPGYMWMSGTSLAAPIVSGAAAALLAVHPDWTSDQAKGALMESVSGLPAISDWAGGVGEVDAARAIAVQNPRNPNAGLDTFVSGASFDSTAWEQSAQSSTDWNATDWNATDWNATDWNATDWNATDWNATDWNATDWNATDWNATDWNASLWQP